MENCRNKKVGMAGVTMSLTDDSVEKIFQIVQNFNFVFVEK